jgi:hypothetical protein
MKTTHAFLKPRWILENIWPDCPYKVNDVFEQHKDSDKLWVINCDNSRVGEIDKIQIFPYLFRKMTWYENRTLEELVSMQYARVIKYVGYWRVDDVVPVLSTKFEDGKLSFLLGRIHETSGHYHPATHIVPATQAEYEVWKEKENSKTSQQ